MLDVLGRKTRTAFRLIRRTGVQSVVATAANRFIVWLSRNPTLAPPSGYTRARADAVYGEAFRKCFEYLEGSGIQGDILEFGTLRGYTARIIARAMKEFDYPATLHLYDSFQGLPDIQSAVDEHSYEVAVNKVWFRGQMAIEPGTDVLIQKALTRFIPSSRLKVVKGFFEDTLPSMLPTAKAAVIHIDCDLYASAKYVLEQVVAQQLLQDGSVMLFDDFNCNRANPRMGERRALAEVFHCGRFAYSPFFSYGWHGQAYFVHDKHAGDALANGVVN